MSANLSFNYSFITVQNCLASGCWDGGLWTWQQDVLRLLAVYIIAGGLLFLFVCAARDGLPRGLSGFLIALATTLTIGCGAAVFLVL